MHVSMHNSARAMRPARNGSQPRRWGWPSNSSRTQGTKKYSARNSRRKRFTLVILPQRRVEGFTKHPLDLSHRTLSLVCALTQ